MKKLLASVGLMAVSASALQAQYASQLSSPQQVKPWAISAALRGFYDDNYTTTPEKTDTFGLDVSPSISLNHSTEQTYLGAAYIYDLKYYERDGTSDGSHQASFKLGHRFTERYSVRVSDSFVVGQDPQVLNEYLTHTPFRVPGNNIRNDGRIGFLAQLTELLDVGVDYNNTMYAFAQHGEASESARLDRFENRPELSLRWHVVEDTTASLNYMFEGIDYTSPESIVPTSGFILDPNSGIPIGTYNTFLPSDIRNAHNHKIFAGVDHTFNPQLRGSLRAGAQINDYYNSYTQTVATNTIPPGIPGAFSNKIESDSVVSPYVDALASYRYAENSTVNLGVRHTHNATDFVGSGSSPVLDQESTAAYISATHQLTGKLSVGALFQYQHSVFNAEGPDFNGDTENFYILDLNLGYRFNPFLLAEAGYAFDNLDSEVARGYSRNRVYVGLRATY